MADVSEGNAVMEENEDPGRFFTPFSFVVSKTPSSTESAAAKIKDESTPPLKPVTKEEHLQVDNILHSSWINEVRTQLNQHCKRALATRPCTIFKVQDNIRRSNPEAYTPLIISIGPYHHKCLPRHSTVIAMENHKWLSLRRLLVRRRSRRSATELLEKCLLAMTELDAEVRSCYSDPLFESLDVQSLALVMLLDGCFILHLLLKQYLFDDQQQHVLEEPLIELSNEEEVGDGDILLDVGLEEEENQIIGTLWIWNFVLYDLLKLENQVPFFILTTLFDLLKVPGDEGVDLVNLVFKLFSDVHPSAKSSQWLPVLPAGHQIHHLLHLFHSTLVPSQHDHQLHSNHNINLQVEKVPEWIPSATELQLAGVKFVKKNNASSFLDVSFENGRMEIPELCLYDYTDTLFRNLIAFEQCYPDTRTYITIYAAFMDCIIDTPKDVSLLHLNGVLSNRLSTDEAAADLFNKLCYQIHYASDRNYLRELFVNVNEYHHSSWNKWRAGLMRDYFSNPWAIISLIAAVVLLLLTIEQSFFSAYSYFRPP
ncbi:hypothetical protein J5N97_010744 [Dioscorea zingiberensis]|uniref:Uncharacterized protein n=1 Tax=Dioscorea zingiberensis TaxID=325984 RepID=A0A9D5HMU5_9LILI|nr:hypothetical protein J5N97_010744 [Dioscorea zingiberensis]